MKNNIPDHNWDALGNKISEYTPDEFSANDWDAMERMLHPPVAPATGIATLLKNNAPLIMSSLALCIAIFMMATSLSDKEISAENSTTATTIEVESLKKNNNVKNSTTGGAASALNDAQQNETATTDVAVDSKNKASIEIVNNAKTTRKNVSSSNNYTNTNTKSANTSRLNQPKTNYTIPIKNDIYIRHITNQKNRNSISDTTSIQDDKSTLIFAPSGFNNIITQNTASNSIDRNTSIRESIPTLGLSNLEIQEFEFPAPPSNKIVAHPFDKRLKFGVQFGLNNSITDYSAFTTSHLPFGGIFVKKRLAKKWEAELGVQYKRVNNYDLKQFWSIELFDQNGLVGFNEENRGYQKYRSFDIPLIIKYQVFGKLWLSHGLRFSFIDSKSVDLASTGSSVNNSRSNIELDKIIPELGFWNKDVGIAFGAEYHISKKTAIDLRWNQGLRDITPDNLYQNDGQTHLNSDLQISLKCTIQ